MQAMHLYHQLPVRPYQTRLRDQWGLVMFDTRAKGGRVNWVAVGAINTFLPLFLVVRRL
jgi:hypothetical protein